MKWIPLNNEEQLEEIKTNSLHVPQVIFKHSSRCAISSMAKSRLDRKEQPEGMDFYFLDIINHRTISNKIAHDFHVPHESPQVLIINKGACVYDESHSGIDMDDIKANAANT
ncbi:bacillithiol system redox-active protein YtxJ [Ginsengibacter hankyongi]|uniref:Bacillithiol system redox-active protein YtxJ n=1 Tax=Ginsengibacter hankyongi TaxID=2607284 RepID=A0A5J5IK38_9BACT|nr:bacillithiol system redox-active protein YtxJ [Ginsengibacter hankyongi]KAA9041171.1 bacillithiol system redox-active protein YtxJ [Ginsengibacter hankyongi]